MFEFGSAHAPPFLTEWWRVVATIVESMNHVRVSLEETCASESGDFLTVADAVSVKRSSEWRLPGEPLPESAPDS